MVMTAVDTSDNGSIPLIGKRVMQGVAKLGEGVRSLAAFFPSRSHLLHIRQKHSNTVPILTAYVVPELPPPLAGNGSPASLRILLLHQYLVRLPYIWPTRHRHLALLSITNM